METGTTAAVNLMEMVWTGACKANKFSWRRYNTALVDALKLAISAGLKFEKGDFESIYNQYRGWYWMGDVENLYTLAVDAKNIKACQSFESWAKRKPFMFLSGSKTKTRLARGSSLPWERETVTVTSFADDGTCLIACSYHDKKEWTDPTRIKRRYRITVKDLRAEMEFIKKHESVRFNTNFWAWVADLLEITSSDRRQIKKRFCAIFNR